MANGGRAICAGAGPQQLHSFDALIRDTHLSGGTKIPAEAVFFLHSTGILPSLCALGLCRSSFGLLLLAHDTYRSFPPIPARSGYTLDCLRGPAIKLESAVDCGMVMARPRTEQLHSRCLFTNNADNHCTSSPSLHAPHTFTRMRRACQALLIYHLRCGIPVSQALPVWRGCQQPLQIASRDRLSKSFAAATMFYVVISVW